MCSTAGATLGGSVDTITADEGQLHAARAAATTAEAGYQVQTLTLASGTVVKEYVNAAGTVFAVTWQGPIKPDLRQLLGRYFSALAAPSQPGTRNIRRMSVRTADVVAESTGRMRSFAGRAYLPGQMPSLVSAGEIR